MFEIVEVCRTKRCFTTMMNPSSDGTINLEDPDIHVSPGIRPLFETWMRDPRVTPGHDGAYYLTGTTRDPESGEINAGRFSDGIRLWRSENLKTWEDLGLVWSIEQEGGALAQFAVYENGVGRTYAPEAFRRDVLPRLLPPGMEQSPEPPGAATATHPIQVRRGVWGPELNWLPRRGEYLLSFCLNTNIAIPPDQWTHYGLFGGNYFLTSPSGDPRGPWKLVSETPMTDHIDGTVFEDGDSIWFIWQNGRMARFNSALDAFDLISNPWQTPYHPEPTSEGPFVVRHEGRYHLFLTMVSRRLSQGQIGYAESGHGSKNSFSYDLIQASSDRLTGPYGPRQIVALGVGHGHPLCDREGNWWLGCFGSPRTEYMPFPEPCRPYLVPMHWRNGLFRPQARVL